jgi:hemerythrin
MKHALYIVWNENNHLGIPIIDEQHRGIVSTINSLHYFIQEGKGLEALKSTLTILKEYTNIHFKTEEALMKNSAYPGFKSHVMLHKGLMEITQEAISYKEPELALKFLKEWWIGHINKEDKKYAPYVKKELGIQ